MATFPTSFGNSFGGFGGDLISNAVGVGSNMGGTLGSLAGGAFFGPLGALGGSFLGNSIGKLFGFGNKKPSRPRVNYTYDFATGNPLLWKSKQFNDETLDAFGSATDYIGDMSASVLKTLGLAPSTDKFGFGTFQGSTGFVLGSDPIPRKDGLPNVFYAIGPDAYEAQARGLGRVFGERGGRTDVPTSELIQQAASGAFDALVSDPIRAAGLTNRQVFEKAGLPTELEALKGALPGLAFGDNFGLDNPFQFKPSELMSLYQQGGGMMGGMTGAPTAGIGAPSNTGNAGRLQSIYAQYQQRMPQGTVRHQPSYYSRWGG